MSHSNFFEHTKRENIQTIKQQQKSTMKLLTIVFTFAWLLPTSVVLAASSNDIAARNLKGTKADKGGKKGDKKDGKKDAKKDKKGKGDKKGKKDSDNKYFNRIASFLICSQLDPTCNTDVETVAEIVVASEDGNTLIYTDAEQEVVGFVDITDPANPVGDGLVALSGEPTSVGIVGGYALVAINTSPDYVNTSGELVVVDIETRAVVRTMDLGGQPDSVAVSPDGNHVGVCIENERDEDLGDGAPPQLPAGFFVVIDTSSSNPDDWASVQVDLTGLPGVKFPQDPEPEFASINSDNVAVISLQENNALVLVDMMTATVLDSFSAGTVDLDQIDLTEEGIILQEESKGSVPREPDGIVWLGTDYFATADEGDLDGGSRGFTIYNTDGEVVYTSGNDMEHLSASIGHYPDERSGNKGNEPENVAYGVYDKDELLFVNSERSSFVAVFDISEPEHPELLQVLPAGVGPEGGLAIPSRDLLVVASEVDGRGDKIRSVLNIYHRSYGTPQYPTIHSMDRGDGTPIPYGALSGLSPDPYNECLLYSIEDSFYDKNRIFFIDACAHPAALYRELTIMDTNDVFANVDLYGDLTQEDLDALINSDKSVNIDPEGIAVFYDDQHDAHYVVASEGSGTVGDASRPIASLNFLFVMDDEGVIEQVISLPDEVNDIQLRFGFEGVAYSDGRLIVAFQRAWIGEDHPRIGVYNMDTWIWEKFVFYELDAVESQNGGWVGLSDISPLGGMEFLVLERDNQGGPDAAVKRIYKIDLDDFSDGDVIENKVLYRDILPDLKAPNGLVYEKVEGLAATEYGVYVVNDNDGVDDNSGEIQLMYLEH